MLPGSATAQVYIISRAPSVRSKHSLDLPPSYNQATNAANSSIHGMNTSFYHVHDCTGGDVKIPAGDGSMEVNNGATIMDVSGSMKVSGTDTDVEFQPEIQQVDRARPPPYDVAQAYDSYVLKSARQARISYVRSFSSPHFLLDNSVPHDQDIQSSLSNPNTANENERSTPAENPFQFPD